MTATRATVSVLLLVAVAGCGGGRARVARGEDATPAACVRLQGERQVRGETLCEDVFSCFRPPGGVVDRIGLRRLAPCAGGGGPVVLFLPGMHMNGEIANNSANQDLRLYLAQAGIRTWSLDYRTHAVRPEASQEDLQTLVGWSHERFLDDAEWATTFVRSTDPGLLYLVGFSFGASMAYGIVSRSDQPIMGLVILDGVPDGGGGEGAASGGSALDVGGGRLSYPDRQRLLDAVIRSPNGPSPVGGYATAGTALADIVYTAPSFGGQGGLSAARNGVTDVRVLARLLDSYDRWWPRAALDGSAARAPRRKVRVLAIASGNMGPTWVERVKSGAKDFGGDRTEFRELPLHGHLDVLVGRLAPGEVYEPTRRFVMGEQGGER
jgi:pimeloyl-ACP methyl ester carboxylesterase